MFEENKVFINIVLPLCTFFTFRNDVKDNACVRIASHP